MARRMAGVGRVTVSERRSTSFIRGSAPGRLRRPLAVPEREVGRDRLGPEDPQHRDHLAAVVGGMIRHVLDELPERRLEALAVQGPVVDPLPHRGLREVLEPGVPVLLDRLPAAAQVQDVGELTLVGQARRGNALPALEPDPLRAEDVREGAPDPAVARAEVPLVVAHSQGGGRPHHAVVRPLRVLDQPPDGIFVGHGPYYARGIVPLEMSSATSATLPVCALSMPYRSRPVPTRRSSTAARMAVAMERAPLMAAVVSNARVNAARTTSSSSAPTAWGSLWAAATAPPRVARAASAASGGTPAGMAPVRWRR